jgi:hypothetical protein
MVWIVRLEIKVHKLLRGKNAKSLEDTILHNLESVNKLKEFQKDAIDYFENIENRLQRSIQSIETVRFNPFKGTGEGGNQSFSTTFINEKGDGVVLSSLYSRDRISIFSKPLEKFDSNFELTDEEKNVVESAKKKIKV